MAMKISKVAVDGNISILCIDGQFQNLLPYSAGPFPLVAQLSKLTYLDGRTIGSA